MELNERKWTIFEIGTLFKFKRGNHIGTTNDLTTGTKVISASTVNNGFVCFSDKPPEYKGNLLSIANTGQGSVGVVFYQDEPFIATNNITVLVPKFNLNRNIALFLLPLFKKERYRLSFGRILNEGRIRKYSIKLPVDENEDPDWKFMEDYIRSITENIMTKVKVELKLEDKQWNNK